MARIQIKTRDVNGTSFLPEHKTPQHTFIIYTKDNGEQYVLRGGQDYVGERAKINNDLNISNIQEGDLEVVLSRYEEGSVDWDDGTMSIHSETIASGSQSDIQVMWNAMITEGQRINNEGYDYEYLTQNCNTSMSHMVQAGEQVVQNKGLEVNWKGVDLPDAWGEEYWTPGLDKEFSHSWVDNIFDVDKEKIDYDNLFIDNSLLNFESNISPLSNNALQDPQNAWLEEGAAIHGGDYKALTDLSIIDGPGFTYEQMMKNVTNDQRILRMKDKKLGIRNKIWLDRAWCLRKVA